MSHYFVVSAVIGLFLLLFFNSRTSHSRFCDGLVAKGPSSHPTDKHSHSRLFLACLTQLWSLSGTGLQCPVG